MSTQYQLTIETHGICTHFTHGVVSGVPHRVVLADSTHIQAGMVAISAPWLGPDRVPVDPPQESGPVLYYLIPHFPHLEIVESSDDGGATRRALTIADLLLNGAILKGSRLQVLNCVDLGVSYRDDFAGPRLTTYYPDYVPSEDVVLNGRASCYLDVYGGSVSYVGPTKPGRPGYMTISMQTNGAPELLVTPLAQSSDPTARAHRVTIEPPEDPTVPIILKLKNAELKRELRAEEELGAYDFLLHYLTARGGIPAKLASPTPGMPAKLQWVSRERMAGALVDLADALTTAKNALTAGDVAMAGPRVLYDVFTESCAPSQYP